MKKREENQSRLLVPKKKYPRRGLWWWCNRTRCESIVSLSLSLSCLELHLRFWFLAFVVFSSISFRREGQSLVNRTLGVHVICMPGKRGRRIAFPDIPSGCLHCVIRCSSLQRHYTPDYPFPFIAVYIPGGTVLLFILKNCLTSIDCEREETVESWEEDRLRR